MVVVWGLDLREIQWGKFKSSYMWNTDYHLRRTKFIVYQLAMITCVVSESLGTAALTDYNKEQNWFQARDPNIYVYNNDIIGITSFNIFAGVYVATIFGAAFFFDLFWPERKESGAVKLAWKICSVFAVIMVFADVIALTVIVGSHTGYITGVPFSTAAQLYREYDGPPLIYRHNGRCVASVVFLWLGLPSTIWACMIMWMSIKHDSATGPWSTHIRLEKLACGKHIDDFSTDSISETLRPNLYTDVNEPMQAANGTNKRQRTEECREGFYEGT